MLAALALLTGCVAPSYRDTRTGIAAQAIDPARYAGTWYEIARFPVPFQRGCAATTATYGVIDAATISVRNTCRGGSPTGPEAQIAGQAEIVGPGKLKVRFDSVPLVAGDYWVLWVDEGYDTAVVGVPSGRAGWVLARTPDVSTARMRRALGVLRANGYDTSKLLFTEH